MTEEAGWTTAQKEALPYVYMYLERGMTGAEALKQYRAGGGHIRTQDWYAVAREVATAHDFSGYIPRLVPWSTIPKAWASEEDVEYSKQYVLKVKVTATDIYGNVYPDLYRYIESDTELTKREWFDKIKDALATDPTLPDLTDYELQEAIYVKRLG
jgi:hypothetical protein